MRRKVAVCAAQTSTYSALGGKLRVFDLYYDDAGNPIGTGEEPSSIYGDTIHDLRNGLELLKAGLELPVLDASSIGKANHEAGTRES